MQRFRRNTETAWRRVESEMLIVATKGNKLTVLNDTGGRVWELLDEAGTIEAIAKEIAAEFQVDATSAQLDVSRLIADLEQRNLVIRVGP